MSVQRDPASFRDPDGFVCEQQGSYYRVVNAVYAATWEACLSSGLLNELMASGKLIALEENELALKGEEAAQAYKVYKLHSLRVLSYPPEWSFAQFKKAALLTLDIQRRALQHGFCLKDASAYNVQFTGKDPVFIDHLSFDKLEAESPWKAYSQFCRHFLAPLLLWHYGVPEPHLQFLYHLDGIPVSHCAAALPWRSKWSLLAFTHIHLHARMEKRHAADRKLDFGGKRYSLQKHLKLLEHLEMGIRELGLPERVSQWTDYYENNSYSTEALEVKQAFVTKYCEELASDFCLDLGANTGVFSFIAAEHFKLVLACDADENVLRAIRSRKKANVLTLRVDLSNPLPAYGWNSRERKAFIERVRHNNLCMALALVHHLCIANNVPLIQLADFFAGLSSHLLIEFVPMEDEQVRKLLVSRKANFPDYTLEQFEKAFTAYYTIADKKPLPGSGRVLYYMTRKPHAFQA